MREQFQSSVEHYIFSLNVWTRKTLAKNSRKDWKIADEKRYSSKKHNQQQMKYW